MLGEIPALGGGLSLSPAKGAMVTLADEVHHELRDRLLRGEFALGHRLVEERTADLLGVSRTPVREALRRLEKEELIEAVPSGGYVPRVPDLGRLHDLYEVRQALEALSVSRACGPRGDRDQLEQLRHRWATMTVVAADAGFVHVDESFHIDLVRTGGNDALVDALHDVNARIRIVRIHDFLVPGRIERTIAEHLAVVEAVLRGDEALAQVTLRDHISDSAALVEDSALHVLRRMMRPVSPVRHQEVSV